MTNLVIKLILLAILLSLVYLTAKRKIEVKNIICSLAVISVLEIMVSTEPILAMLWAAAGVLMVIRLIQEVEREKQQLLETE